MDGEVKKKLPRVATRIFGEDRPIGIRYVSSPLELVEHARDGRQALQDAFAGMLARHLGMEARARRCLVGPQRDDIDVTLGERPLASFASAGEQRRTAFVLVMTATELAVEANVSPTVVLIDDVEAEFDDERLDRVLAFLGGATQSLVATSKANVAERYAPLGRVLRVEGGRFRDTRHRTASTSQGAND